MEQDRLVQATSLLKNLKDKIKCPICLEVIQDLCELSCGHKFCNDCLFQYKSLKKNISCPLCKTVISRRAPIYKDEYSDRLGKFFFKISEYLKTVSNTEERNLLQENDNRNEINVKLKPKKALKSCPQSTAKLNKTDSDLKIKKTPDKLPKVTYNSLLLNKCGTKHVYTKKTQPKISEPEYKIHDFDNSENKVSVLQWLNDTRNKFDRLTQTQLVNPKIVGEEENILILPSVSQFKGPEYLNIHPLACKGRAKSEEIEIKKHVPRRRTYSDLSKASDNYHIEEVYTEEEKLLEKAQENILLDLIETKYLKKLEEIENTLKPKNEKNKSVLKPDKEYPINESAATPNSVTGWNRMTEIKKSIETSAKMHKKLKVILNASQCSLKSSNKRTDEKENLSLAANANNLNVDQKEKRKVYDLNALESYIAQNIAIENNKDEYDAYFVPTQKLNFGENKEESLEKVEDIIPTQKLHNEDVVEININSIEPIPQQHEEISINSNDVSIENQIMHLNSTVDLLNLLEKYLQRCNTTKDVSLLENNLISMEIILKKIKSISENVCPTNKVSTNVSTQTEINMMHQSTQTFQTSNDESEMLAINQSSTLVGSDIRSNKTQNEIFTCTLDNLNVDTQEIIKNQIQKPLEISKNCDEINQYEYASKCSNQSLQQLINSQLVCTTSDKLETIKHSESDYIKCTKMNQDNNTLKCSNKSLQKLTNSQLICTIQSTSSKLKRTRSSESDDIIKPIVKKNRFFNDDLSIEFTDTIRPEESKLASSPECNSINYDECLEQILKKYDNRLTEKIEGEGTSENILKQCNAILEQDTTNRKQHTNLKQNSEFTDVISESESLESVPKKLKLSELDQAITVHNSMPNKVVTDNHQQDNICNELNDSLEDIDFENIEFPQEHKSLKFINVLNDVVIRNPHQKENNEDDMFSEDEDDIVESTPQKNLPDMHSQKSQRSRMEIVFPENNDAIEIKETCDFDIVVLPPPPGFQDFEITDSSSNITVIDCNIQKEETEINTPNKTKTNTLDKLSISPKKQTKEMSHNNSYLQDLDKRDVNLHKHSLVNTSKIEHSTPLPQVDVQYQSLPCISPIPKEKENNLRDTLQSSITSLIATPKRHTPKHTILSSTPKQKSIWNYIRTSQELANEIKVKPKPCISCSRLSHTQLKSISQLTNKKLATYSSTFHKDVTHMIVTVDDNNCLKDYTAKFVAAVAAGIWVLKFDWIQDSLNKNTILPEEPYEIYDDVHGMGPKTSRLTKRENPLFKDFKFHCTNDFFSTTKKDIEDIIEMLDGKVIKKPEDLVQKDGKIGLIITEGRATEDFEIYERWLELYKVATVDIEWLSRSIGRYKLLSIRPYIWCSDNYLEHLGYPEYLIEQVPFSTE